MTLATDIKKLKERFGFRADDLDYEPHYNLAPTQMLLAVLDDHAEMLRWGLIPFWAKDPSIGGKMINARSDTLMQKPAFREALEKRRCLVLADGFYEWKTEGRIKTPLYIGLPGHEPFAMAGLWSSWKSPSGERIRSCTVITTQANRFMESIHDRMPVILPREAEEAWLDADNHDVEELGRLLVPYPEGSLVAWQVSPQVNSTKNDNPGCIAPVEVAPGPRAVQGTFDFADD